MSKGSIVGKVGKFNICFEEVSLSSHAGMVLLHEFAEKLGVNDIVLEKLPTRLFHANWAYLLIGQLAFNLLAWFKRLVLPSDYHQATAKIIRHHLLNVAGKIVHTARQFFVVISDQYRYQPVWRFAIQQLASLNLG